RAATVAGIHRRIGLEESLATDPVYRDCSVTAGDEPTRNRQGKAEREPDCSDALAKSRGTTRKAKPGSVPRAVALEERNIAKGDRTHNRSVARDSSVLLESDRLGAVNDMLNRCDEPRSDNDAGADLTAIAGGAFDTDDSRSHVCK